jgi:hypothetical protein
MSTRSVQYWSSHLVSLTLLDEDHRVFAFVLALFASFIESNCVPNCKHFGVFVSTKVIVSKPLEQAAAARSASDG